MSPARRHCFEVDGPQRGASNALGEIAGAIVLFAGLFVCLFAVFFCLSDSTREVELENHFHHLVELLGVL